MALASGLEDDTASASELAATLEDTELLRKLPITERIQYIVDIRKDGSIILCLLIDEAIYGIVKKSAV